MATAEGQRKAVVLPRLWPTAFTGCREMLCASHLERIVLEMILHFVIFRFLVETTGFEHISGDLGLDDCEMYSRNAPVDARARVTARAVLRANAVQLSCKITVSNYMSDNKIESSERWEDFE